jgi:hypothetical protein
VLKTLDFWPNFILDNMAPLAKEDVHRRALTRSELTQTEVSDIL